VLNLDEHALNIFTDGSCLPEPRRGGIAFRIVVVDEDGHEVPYDEQLPGRRAATSQEMELLAPIEALNFVNGRHSPVDPRNYAKVVVYTDSQYLANNLYNAQVVWPKRKWFDRDGNPIVNAALWKELVHAVQKTPRTVRIAWAKGHSASNPHNKAVDKLAKASARGHLREPVTVSRVRRKHTSESTEAGSVKAEGQRVTLRIIQDRWLKPQRMYMYKYEVTSTESRFFGKVDTIYSDQMLSAGHEYEVQLNSDPRRPRIERVYGEV
jgi:ribonuclease HI